SQSAMASFHLNAFRLSRGFLYTAWPRANPVRTAINRRCRNCWRNRHRNVVGIVHRLAAGEFIDLRSSSGLGTSTEWATKRNYRPNLVRNYFSEFTGINAPKAPTDDADLPVMLMAKLPHTIKHAVLNAFTETSVKPESPAFDRVASTFQKFAKGQRRVVTGHQPGYHQHRMAIPLWRQMQERERMQKSA